VLAAGGAAHLFSRGHSRSTSTAAVGGQSHLKGGFTSGGATSAAGAHLGQSAAQLQHRAVTGPGRSEATKKGGSSHAQLHSDGGALGGLGKAVGTGRNASHPLGIAGSRSVRQGTTQHYASARGVHNGSPRQVHDGSGQRAHDGSGHGHASGGAGVKPARDGSESSHRSIHGAARHHASTPRSQADGKVKSEHASSGPGARPGSHKSQAKPSPQTSTETAVSRDGHGGSGHGGSGHGGSGHSAASESSSTSTTASASQPHGH
jgi:hypothetical protein